MGRYLKEGIIILLIIIAIVILLVIALYEYAPANKNISTVKTYERTADVSKTLQEISTTDLSVGSSESIIKSYSISSSDLKNYEKASSYDKGRANPFADLEENEDGNANTATNSTSGANNNSNSGNGTKQEGYFNSTGKNK